MKQTKMQKSRNLHQFKYCDVNSEFELSVNSDLNYFKNKINTKAHWNSSVIDLSSTPDIAAFDSGIVCATSDALPSEVNEISKLNCFFAPYSLCNILSELYKNHAQKRKSKY